MFRIRPIYDDLRRMDRQAVAQVQQIMRSQFPGAPEKDALSLPGRLLSPLNSRLRYLLLVAEDARLKVKGFALLSFAPDLNFCFLDYLAATRGLTGGGVGGALYEQARREARRRETMGIFMECLPDDPALCRDPERRKANRSRLRFYERFGAFPVINTAYETPLKPGDDCPPYLVFDNLGQELNLRRAVARKVAQAILERKYGDLCPPAYIQMVVRSFKDDPVRLRPPRYIKPEAPAARSITLSRAERLALVVNDRHDIHHVKERGYVEAPVRVSAILKELEPLNICARMDPRHFSEEHILAVHDPRFVAYLKRVCRLVEPGKSIYPYIFPIRNAARPPKELPVRAGYYCIDTFTPLNQNAYLAARRAVDCALTAAESLLAGFHLAYALVRPPGHHAERKVFGGFCYFNSAAVAAHFLSAHGKVAVIDLDYHHGNGTQDIFYLRSDVFTASIHGHPSFAYPYFSGFREETGEGAGLGFNLNLPLGETVNGLEYRRALDTVLKAVRRFGPRFLVVALGLDTAKGDPTGSWQLTALDFAANGQMVAGLKLPTLVVQEGGYRIASLGKNARSFFSGLAGLPAPQANNSAKKQGGG